MIVCSDLLKRCMSGSFTLHLVQYRKPCISADSDLVKQDKKYVLCNVVAFHTQLSKYLNVNCNDLELGRIRDI